MNLDFHRRESRPRAPVGEWVLAVLLSANLAWSTFALGGYPASVMAVSIGLTTALGVVCLIRCALARRGPIGPVAETSRAPGAQVAGLWLWPFVGYAAASAIWISPVPWLGWFDWAKWLQLAVIFGVTANGLRTPRPRQLVFIALALIAVGGVAIACYQRFVNPAWLMLGEVQVEQFLRRSSGPFGAPNSFAGLLLLLLPATAALTARRGGSAVERVGWGWVTAVLGVGLALTISRGAWIALATAVILAPLLLRNDGWRRRLRRASGVTVAVLVTGSVIYFAAPPARERLGRLVQDSGERSRPILWWGAWELFRANPVLGSGAGSFETGFEFHRPAGFSDRPEWAHNDYLNTLSDYGLIGMGLLGAGVVLTMRRRPRAEVLAKTRWGHDWTDSPAFRGGLALGLLAFALQLVVDFHLKLPALGLAFSTLAGLALNRGDRDHDEKRPGRPTPRFVPGVAAAALLTVGVGLVVHHWAEGWRTDARATLDRLARMASPEPAEIEAVQDQLRRAGTWSARNGSIWSDLADATMLLATTKDEPGEALGRAAELAADRALGCSAEVFEFWLQRGLARNLQGRWVEAGDDFARALALAPANARVWFYYAEHLSRNPSQRALAAGALELCLRLDPNCREAISLRQSLAAGATVP